MVKGEFHSEIERYEGHGPLNREWVGSIMHEGEAVVRTAVVVFSGYGNHGKFEIVKMVLVNFGDLR